MIFQVSYERFLEEIRFEKIGQGAKDQLEVEDLGSMFAYYLICFQRNKTFVFIVEKSEITEVIKFELNSKSKPSRRIIEDTQLKSISESLKRIEENMNKLPIRERIIEREIPVEVEVKK